MNEENKIKYEAILLGALLHDIGKFCQRASDKPRSMNHSKWGEEWFQEHLQEKLTPVFTEEEKQIICSAIGNHHYSEQYISLADAISAGMDRIPLEIEEEGDPLTTPLISIFSRISISNTPKKKKYHRLLPLGKESLVETFPVEKNKYSLKEYSELLKTFEQEIKSFDATGCSTLNVINFLYFLLWKHTWCIPSAAYKDEPDVSLFDHLKTTAAIAGCLHQYHEQNHDVQLSLESKAFSLIGGDISGIQSFIFDVLTQQGKVAKRLRARSLFVQMISEIASYKILHQFNLPLCNLILSAGGNFSLLVPNINKTDEIVKKLQKEFDQWTLYQLNGEISLHLVHIEFSGKDLIFNKKKEKDVKTFMQIIERLKNELNKSKAQPHKSMLSSHDKWSINAFLRPESIEGDEKACQGCHKNPVKETPDNEENLCERCMNDIVIGKSLHGSKYIAIFANDTKRFKILDYSFELWNEIDLQSVSVDKPFMIFRLNSTETDNRVPGFKYFVTHIPVMSDSYETQEQISLPLTFDDIARRSKGDALIGYLKADVDNLGKILTEGFSRKIKFSISTFATLSRMLETFFSGWLQKKTCTDYMDIYSIFSGGDDFFVIGPWNASIDFAKSIRSDFSRYCAENPDMTFSSGIILSKPHEPLSFCAKSVENELAKSKRPEVKNRITLFGQTLQWEELENILNEAKEIIEWLERKPSVISRGFAYNLREYGEMADKSGIFKSGVDINAKFLRFVPLLVHDINRNLKREDQKDAYAWAMDLRPTKDKPGGGTNLPYLKIIMEYVLTYTRGG